MSPQAVRFWAYTSYSSDVGRMLQFEVFSEFVGGPGSGGSEGPRRFAKPGSDRFVGFVVDVFGAEYPLLRLSEASVPQELIDVSEGLDFGWYGR